MSEKSRKTDLPLQPWRRLQSREVFSNHWIRVQIDRVELPDGRPYDYTVIHRFTEGVAALVFDDQNRVLMEREYRYPVDEVIWQLPGGLVDRDEEPLPAMQRELAEETGYVAETWEYLGQFWDNPALSAMRIHLFLARDVHNSAATHFDEAEFVSVEWRSWEWVKEAVRTGEIRERVLLSALGILLARGQC
jgi:ADP-ribose pyrophosphatase